MTKPTLFELYKERAELEQLIEEVQHREAQPKIFYPELNMWCTAEEVAEFETFFNKALTDVISTNLTSLYVDSKGNHEGIRKNKVRQTDKPKFHG